MKKVLVFGTSNKKLSPIYVYESEDLNSGLSAAKIDVIDGSKNPANLNSSDAVVAFPGGIETLGGITDVLAKKERGEFKGEVLFVNVLDSWRPLFDYFEELKMRNMISENFDNNYKSFESVKDLLSHLTKQNKKSTEAGQ